MRVGAGALRGWWGWPGCAPALRPVASRVLGTRFLRATCLEEGMDEFSKSLLTWAVSLALRPRAPSSSASSSAILRLSAAAASSSSATLRSARSARSSWALAARVACATASSPSRLTISQVSHQPLIILALSLPSSAASRLSERTRASYSRCSDSRRATSAAYAAPDSSSSILLACARTFSCRALTAAKSSPIRTVSP